MWYELRPHRLHNVCVLFRRLPKLDVPFVILHEGTLQKEAISPVPFQNRMFRRSDSSAGSQIRGGSGAQFEKRDKWNEKIVFWKFVQF